MNRQDEVGRRIRAGGIPQRERRGGTRAPSRRLPVRRRRRRAEAAATPPPLGSAEHWFLHGTGRCRRRRWSQRMRWNWDRGGGGGGGEEAASPSPSPAGRRAAGESSRGPSSWSGYLIVRVCSRKAEKHGLGHPGPSSEAQHDRDEGTRSLTIWLGSIKKLPQVFLVKNL